MNTARGAEEEQIDWVGGNELDLCLDDIAPGRSERIFIEYMGPSTNEIYAGIHWRKRQKQADTGHFAVSLVKAKPFRKPVQLTFQPVVGKGGRVRDCSNYSYTAKIIEDGLVAAGILENDTPEFVKGFAIDEPVIDRTRASGMWVCISEVD